MCNCVNVKIGSYDNQVCLGFYECMREYADNRRKLGLSEYGICVDRCLMNEIIFLWEHGIRTYGCCCGHNTGLACINIDEEDFVKALQLGYKKYHFPDEPNRDDTIIPMTTYFGQQATTDETL